MMSASVSMMEEEEVVDVVTVVVVVVVVDEPCSLPPPTVIVISLSERFERSLRFAYLAFSVSSKRAGFFFASFS